jgi:hypothetical protein
MEKMIIFVCFIAVLWGTSEGLCNGDEVEKNTDECVCLSTRRLDCELRAEMCAPKFLILTAKFETIQIRGEICEQIKGKIGQMDYDHLVLTDEACGNLPKCT